MFGLDQKFSLESFRFWLVKAFPIDFESLLDDVKKSKFSLKP